MAPGTCVHAYDGMQWSRCLRRRALRTKYSQRCFSVAARAFASAASPVAPSAACQAGRHNALLLRHPYPLSGTVRAWASSAGKDTGTCSSELGVDAEICDSTAASEHQHRSGRHFREHAQEPGRLTLAEGLGGPILADFLAMGGGHVPASPKHAASSGVSPHGRMEPLRERPMQQGPSAHMAPAPKAAVRERRLIVAALQQREPLMQDQRETPQRPAVTGMRLRTPERMPKLFQESYSSFREALQAADEAIGDDGEHAAAVPSAGLVAAETGTPRRRPRLRVLPWHREALQQMLCRAVLFHFLQDRRQALGLRVKDHPLWFWEVRRAQEYTAAGQVAVLVKYLAETELHITQGPERRQSPPGSMPLFRASQLLRAERRKLVQEWEASGQRLKSRNFQEDAFVRVFLDGHLSWPKVRDMIGFQSPGPSAAEQHQ